MFDLTGRNALVTGASGGIGGAVAEALHAAGATVALSGTREAPLRELAEKLGSRAHVVTANLSDAAAVEALPKAAAEAMGSVDVLVNNAGITRDGMFHKMTKDQWNAVINTNLNSLFNMTRPVWEGMRARKFGRVICISSINGQKGQMGQTNYSAAKAGVIGFTKALALENARKGVTVNCIAPGYIDTEMVQAVPENVLASIIGQIPVGRLGKGEEIADMVAFLAGEHAGYVTGSTLSLNGGQYMAG